MGGEEIYRIGNGWFYAGICGRSYEIGVMKISTFTLDSGSIFQPQNQVLPG